MVVMLLLLCFDGDVTDTILAVLATPAFVFTLVVIIFEATTFVLLPPTSCFFSIGFTAIILSETNCCEATLLARTARFVAEDDNEDEERNERPMLFKHSGELVFEESAPVKSFSPCACVLEVEKVRRPFAICEPAKLVFPSANVGVVDGWELRRKFCTDECLPPYKNDFILLNILK